MRIRLHIGLLAGAAVLVAAVGTASTALAGAGHSKNTGTTASVRITGAQPGAGSERAA